MTATTTETRKTGNGKGRRAARGTQSGDFASFLYGARANNAANHAKKRRQEAAARVATFQARQAELALFYSGLAQVTGVNEDGERTYESAAEAQAHKALLPGTVADQFARAMIAHFPSAKAVPAEQNRGVKVSKTRVAGNLAADDYSLEEQSKHRGALMRGFQVASAALAYGYDLAKQEQDAQYAASSESGQA